MYVSSTISFYSTLYSNRWATLENCYNNKLLFVYILTSNRRRIYVNLRTVTAFTLYHILDNIELCLLNDELLLCTPTDWWLMSSYFGKLLIYKIFSMKKNVYDDLQDQLIIWCCILAFVGPSEIGFYFYHCYSDQHLLWPIKVCFRLRIYKKPDISF